MESREIAEKEAESRKMAVIARSLQRRVPIGIAS